MHYVGKFEDSALAPHSRYAGRSDGYAEAALVNDRTGSVHTGLDVSALAVNGHVSPHVHSFEEGFYVLAGRAELTIEGRTYRLGPGDFGALKVGTQHAWRNRGNEPARWLQMAAPQPKPIGRERDTFFQIGRAHVRTPVTSLSRMPSSA